MKYSLGWLLQQSTQNHGWNFVFWHLVTSPVLKPPFGYSQKHFLVPARHNFLSQSVGTSQSTHLSSQWAARPSFSARPVEGARFGLEKLRYVVDHPIQFFNQSVIDNNNNIDPQRALKTCNDLSPDLYLMSVGKSTKQCSKRCSRKDASFLLSNIELYAISAQLRQNTELGSSSTCTSVHLVPHSSGRGRLFRPFPSH